MRKLSLFPLPFMRSRDGMLQSFRPSGPVRLGHCPFPPVPPPCCRNPMHPASDLLLCPWTAGIPSPPLKGGVLPLQDKPCKPPVSLSVPVVPSYLGRPAVRWPHIAPLPLPTAGLQAGSCSDSPLVQTVQTLSSGMLQASRMIAQAISLGLPSTARSASQSCSAARVVDTVDPLHLASLLLHFFFLSFSFCLSLLHYYSVCASRVPSLSPSLRPSVPPSLRPSVPPSLRPSPPHAHTLTRSQAHTLTRSHICCHLLGSATRLHTPPLPLGTLLLGYK
jgi:hypothetical protein